MEKYIEKHPEVPEHVMADLREQLGIARDDEERDLEILCLEPSEFLEKWMRWNGMVGWTEDIIDAIAMAYGIDLRSYPLERAVERRISEW